MLVRAARLLADPGDLWMKATATERAEIAAGLFAELRVRDDRVVAATLAHDDSLPLIASATARTQVGVARPEGFEPPILWSALVGPGRVEAFEAMAQVLVLLMAD